MVSGVVEEITSAVEVQLHCLTTTTMATLAPGRGRLYDTEQTLDIILQSVSDAESDDEDLGEPTCPGSDEEFPDPDTDDIW